MQSQQLKTPVQTRGNSAAWGEQCLCSKSSHCWGAPRRSQRQSRGITKSSESKLPRHAANMKRRVKNRCEPVTSLWQGRGKPKQLSTTPTYRGAARGCLSLCKSDNDGSHPGVPSDCDQENWNKEDKWSCEPAELLWCLGSGSTLSITLIKQLCHYKCLNFPVNYQTFMAFQWHIWV